MTKLPYTRSELEAIKDDQFPDRGEFCEKCQTFIPCFADLSADDERRIRAFPSKAQQQLEVRRVTGCQMRWAKIWVIHPNGPEPKFGSNGSPCPKCGAPLRTELARQCVECGADWH